MVDCREPLSWLRYQQTRSQGLLGVDYSSARDSGSVQPPTRRRYPPNYKAAILAEYDLLDRAGKRQLLQRENLYTSLLSQWRVQRDRGALAALSARRGRPPADPIQRHNAQLRERAARLEADLAEARAVIHLQGELLAALRALTTSNDRA